MFTGYQPVTSYDIFYQTNHPDSPWNQTVLGGSGFNKVIITPLFPNTDYVFRVRAVNVVGPGNFSQPEQIKTQLARKQKWHRVFSGPCTYVCAPSNRQPANEFCNNGTKRDFDVSQIQSVFHGKQQMRDEVLLLIIVYSNTYFIFLACHVTVLISLLRGDHRLQSD